MVYKPKLIEIEIPATFIQYFCLKYDSEADFEAGISIQKSLYLFMSFSYNLHLGLPFFKKSCTTINNKGPNMDIRK